MKPTSERINPVKQVAQQREKSAANNLNQSQRQFGAAQNKLHELIQYRADYVSEFQHKAKKGMSGSQLHHYKTFLGQLDRAIGAQQEAIESLKIQLNQNKQSWQKSNQRAKIVSDYQTRMQQKESHSREQQQNRALEDDYNNMRYGGSK